MNSRLKQTAAGKTQKSKAAGPTPAELLARMPRRPLTPEQQAAALEKVQQQATQRVKLGQQLFEAADAKLKQQQDVLKEIQDQQNVLREKVQEDVAKSLQSYDQWMGKIDESFTSAIKKLNERLDQLELRVDASRGELEAMIEKATALMGQTQGLMAEAFESGAAAAGSAPDATIHAEPLDQVFEIDEPDGKTIDEFGASLTEAQRPPIEKIEADVTAEMQCSVPIDPHCDLDGIELTAVEIDANLMDCSALIYQPQPAEPEVFEVEVVESSASAKPAQEDDFAAFDEQSDSDDDVFGEVLRRLRKQAEDSGHDAAA